MGKKRTKSVQSGTFPGLWWKSGASLFIFLLLFASYKIILVPNIAFQADKHLYLVKNPVSVHALADTLKSHGVIKSSLLLRCMAELRGVSQINKGLYTFRKNWNNFKIISELSRETSPHYVRVEVPSYKLRKNVVEKACLHLKKVNKSEVWSLLRDPVFLDSLGYTKENVFSIFLPGVYYLPADITARELVENLHHQYRFFWNEERQEKADKLKLSREEISVLASIVYSETKNRNEMPLVAGVYLNRLEQNMRLQSDPTVIYAAHKFGARRVYFKDRKINSPYNTYRYHGLPPGPIHCTPSWAIDAVLEYEDHSYLYFCAKDDLSGCHLFTETFEEHKLNADKYRKALDRAGIM